MKKVSEKLKIVGMAIAIGLSSHLIAGENPQLDPLTNMILFLEKQWLASEGAAREAIDAQLQDVIKLKLAQPFKKVSMSQYQNSREGVLQFAKEFATGSRDFILSSLPTPEETRMFCATGEDAAMVDRYLEMFKARLPLRGLAQVKKADQTEIQVVPSTSTAVKEGTDQLLPSGYSQTAERYQAGVNFYGFRYAKPGESLGMRYDVCVYVNGRMVFVPKMWRAFP